MIVCAVAALTIYLAATRSTQTMVLMVCALGVYQITAACVATLFIPAMAEQRMLWPALGELSARTRRIRCDRLRHPRRPTPPLSTRSAQLSRGRDTLGWRSPCGRCGASRPAVRVTFSADAMRARAQNPLVVRAPRDLRAIVRADRRHHADARGE